MNKVVIFGNGQMASLNYMQLKHDSPHEVVAFTVDQAYIREKTLYGLPVVPFEDIERVFPPGEFKMSILISYRKVNKIRGEKYRLAKAKGYELVSYVSSKAVIWPDLVLGENSFILENVIVGPFAAIGNDVFIGSGSLISHHSIIKDHCYVSPRAIILGSTTVEPYCMIGAGSIIKDGGVVIARECIIGAGALINQNTREKGVYMGNPGKLAPKNSAELSNWLTWGVK